MVGDDSSSLVCKTCDGCAVAECGETIGAAVWEKAIFVMLNTQILVCFVNKHICIFFTFQQFVFGSFVVFTVS